MSDMHDDAQTTIKGLGGIAILFMVVAGAFGATANDTMVLMGALGLCAGTALMRW